MAGRPTKYDESYPDQVEKLCKLGAIDKEIAEFFNVDVATINRWKIEHPEFCESIKKGKVVADMEVAEKLFKRATGYSYKEITKELKKVKGEIDLTYTNELEFIIEEHLVTTKEVTKEMAPDPIAIIFWLKNRQSSKWRDKQEVGLTGKDGGPIQTESTTKIDIKKLSVEEKKELLKILKKSGTA